VLRMLLQGTIAALASVMTLVAIVPVASAEDNAPHVVAFIDPNAACTDVRFVVGTALTRDERDGHVSPGEVKAIQRVIYTRSNRPVGYVYKTREGREFLIGRAAALMTPADLSVVNKLVSMMGLGRKPSAITASENGYVYHEIKWSPSIARRINIALSACVTDATRM
jgi:hypothetical protein